MDKEKLKKSISDVIEEIVMIEGEGLIDVLTEVEETEGKWMDVRNYLLKKGYDEELLDEIGEEICSIYGIVGYAHEYEIATQDWGGGSDLIADYLVETNIDLANKYYDIWNSYLGEIKTEYDVESRSR